MHTTRGVSSSWALLKGVSVEDICKAASWSSRHTFIRFYMLDVAEPSFLQGVLQAGDLWIPWPENDIMMYVFISVYVLRCELTIPGLFPTGEKSLIPVAYV